jgi:glycosyltransferase involved in cell wall biosynthesis
MFAYSVANKLRLPVFSRFLPLRMYNLAFQRLLSRSSLIYTASEGFGIPIRKYFEIPAAGAAMLCAPCNGFKEIGFRPGEHYVHTIPDDLVGAALELAKDLGKAQVIARSCQAMVREKHSLTARAGQLRNCLDLLLAGTYAGSQWIGGEHRIEL